MVRTYTREEITTVHKFPTTSYEEIQEDGSKRKLICEWPIYDTQNGCFCVVIRKAIPSILTSQLFEECKRDCILQITNTTFTTYLQPRLNCVYADYGITKMKYSRTEVPTIPWTPLMERLRNYVSRDGFHSNAALVNGYIKDTHRVDYHEDKDLKDGRDIVATVSLGGSRLFSFFRNIDSFLLPPIWLHDGDLVFFYQNTNKYYKHAIIAPFYGTDSRPRYSVTFRVIDRI